MMKNFNFIKIENTGTLKKQKRTNSIIEDKEFNHNISLLDTWKENADFILNWADNVLIQNDFSKGKVLTKSLY